MRDIELCGVEYPILDIIYGGVPDRVVTDLGYKKRDVIPVDAIERSRIIAALEKLDPTYVPGGAAANSLSAFAGFGGKTAFIARCGQDQYGEILLKDFDRSGILRDGLVLCQEPSGICVIVTTEDAERTMFPSVEAGLRLKPSDLNLEIFKRAQWIFTQAYMLPYSQDLKDTLYKTLDLAVESGCKLAFSLSAPGIAKAERETLLKIIPRVDLLFANEFEATELSGKTCPKESALFLAEYCKHVVVTAGAEGVWIIADGEISHVAAFECQPVDLTGAGDMFAGAYLFGLVRGLSVPKAARVANYLAMQVITRVGARVEGDLQKLWLEACTKSEA